MCLLAAWEFQGTFKSCVRQASCLCVCVCVSPVCAGERAWDRLTAHVEAVVMATEDVSSSRSAIFQLSHGLLSSVARLGLTRSISPPLRPSSPHGHPRDPSHNLLPHFPAFSTPAPPPLSVSHSSEDINRGHKLHRGCQRVLYECVCVCTFALMTHRGSQVGYPSR